MPDWPGFGFSRNVISWLDTFDAVCMHARAASSALAWPAANRAIFVPVYIQSPVVAKRLFISNGTPSGNFDIGIYRDDLSLVVSSGSTAQAGTIGNPQWADIADTPLSVGRHYLALAFNNNTGSVFRWAPDLVTCRMLGLFKMDAGFPLPALAVPVAVTDQYIPSVAIDVLRTG